MVTSSESILLLVYITTMLDGKVTEAELENLKLRILSYPIFEKITVKREDN